MTAWLWALAINTPLALGGWLAKQKALTPAGLLHAWLLGVLVWGGWGWRGYVIVAVYFVVGVGFTRLGRAIKEAKGIAEKRGGARGPENVWGSAFTGAVCALGNALAPHPLWWLAYCASFAAKLADTTSSEVGKAYGKRTFLITTGQPVAAGTEGAISLEGTVRGWLLAIAMTGLGSIVGAQGLGWPWWVACASGAIAATTFESWLGVVLQPRLAWLSNELVNGIQTTVAALLAVAVGQLVG